MTVRQNFAPNTLPQNYEATFEETFGPSYGRLLPSDTRIIFRNMPEVIRLDDMPQLAVHLDAMGAIFHSVDPNTRLWPLLFNEFRKWDTTKQQLTRYFLVQENIQTPEGMGCKLGVAAIIITNPESEGETVNAVLGTWKPANWNLEAIRARIHCPDWHDIPVIQEVPAAILDPKDGKVEKTSRASTRRKTPATT